MGYFDYAAATPVDVSVIDAMATYLSDQFYNPSAQYAPARKVAQAVGYARMNVALILGCKPVEVVFTAGATEANNIAIQGIMDQYPNSKVLYSSIEHDSVRLVAGNYESQEIPVNQQGLIDLEAFLSLADDEVVLVSVMLANNEIGTVQPLRKLAQAIQDIRKDRRLRGVERPIYLHTDAAQAGNYLDIHVSRLGVDLMSLNGGKIYGPKQVGVLFVRSGTLLKPLLYGGGQERSLRSGTENVAGIIGFSVALELTEKLRNDEVRRLAELRDDFIEHVTKNELVSINGSMKKRLPNNIHLLVDGFDNERLVMQLDSMGHSVATGSACSASDDEPSHVLRAIGMPDERIQSCLRITLGRQTDKQSLDQLAEALLSLLA